MEEQVRLEDIIEKINALTDKLALITDPHIKSKLKKLRDELEDQKAALESQIEESRGQQMSM